MTATAENYFLENYTRLENDGNFSIVDIENAMIEFAKLHVTEALKQASEKAKVFQHSRDGKVSTKSKIVRQKIMISEVDKESILSAYPLENIK